ncbi:MAG: glycosyltransferase [Pseudomonadota bacterium]
MHIGFTAPLKPVDHPVPSGDRAMARAVLSALRSFATVEVASTLRTWDGHGNPTLQGTLRAQAAAEVARLASAPYDAWVTYHNYYKAPDLVGPTVARTGAIPYYVVEASRAPARRTGPWADFATAADAATDAADAVFFMTDRDLPALLSARPTGQRLVRLRPFLDRADLPQAKSPGQGLLAVGMLRPGDKTESYRALAAALPYVSEDWTLRIIGDGPAAPEVRKLFDPFGDRVALLGAKTSQQVLGEMRAARALAWPGVNEAFGMVYLEAQSVGLRPVAEDRPGVRDVLAADALRSPPGNARAYAAALSQALTTAEPIDPLRAHIRAYHLRTQAAETLAQRIAGPTIRTAKS